MTSCTVLATSLLREKFPYDPQRAACTAMLTVWDRVYVVGAGAVFVYGEIVHPCAFGNGGVDGEGRLPFLPLMLQSVYGAMGVVVCWALSFRGPSIGRS